MGINPEADSTFVRQFYNIVSKFYFPEERNVVDHVPTLESNHMKWTHLPQSGSVLHTNTNTLIQEVKYDCFCLTKIIHVLAFVPYCISIQYQHVHKE